MAQHYGSLPSRLDQIESDQRDNIGPISIQAPWAERRDNVLAYFDPVSTGSNHLDSHSFGDIVRELLGESRNRLRPVGFEHVVSYMQTDTNSGLPRFTRRSSVEGESIELAKQQSKEGPETYPAILGWRGQSGGPSTGDVKQRTVWMFPFSTNIREYRYFKPLFDVVRTANWGSAWTDQDGVNAAVTRMLDSCSGGRVVLSTDFSGYDQSIGPELQEIFFELIRFAFQGGDLDEVDSLEQIFESIPILCTPDSEISGLHGVPSGSVFTNICDSVVHRYLQYVASNELGNSVDIQQAQVQGDDGLLCVDSDVVRTILEIWGSVGFEANPDKQFVGDSDCTYLQRYYTKDHRQNGEIVGIYPTYRALNSLMSQERFYDPDRWGSDMVTLRTLMILENTKYHPLFEEFVLFTAKGDKDELGLRNGNLDSIISPSTISRAKSLPGLVPMYNQERNIGGIREFETYRFLKEQGA